MKVKILTFGLLILFSSIVFAQQDSVSIYDLSLEQLLNMPVSTGNVKEKNIRETPGIISVINADDIKKTGARDLIDLLQLIPGIQFGGDIQNYVGIGMRGLWCSEGRVALFIDDVECNDLGYGSMPFGNHFPLDQIEKIEIIRGPGSSMYGGNAQYGVIKITTKKGTLNGAEVSSTLGQEWKEMNFRYDNWIPRRNFNMQIGKKYKNGSVYASGFTGQAQRSSGDYIDFYSGEKFSFENASQLNTYSFLLNGNYKDLDASFWFDNYSMQGRDLYGQAFLTPNTIRFFTMAGVLKYEKKLSDKFTLKPMFSYKMQNPWYVMDTLTTPNTYDSRFTRLNPRLDLIYSPVSHIDILVGGQYYADHGEALFGQLPFMPDSTVALFYDDATEVDFSNIITYAQATASFGGFNFTLGGRYEKHSEGFTSVVPRFAITKAFDKIHFKILASQSFRSPFIYNFMDTTSIVPEKANIFEFETGYKFTDNLFLQLNAFHIETQDMLYYFNNPLTGIDGYYNSEEKSGSIGFESELKYIQKKFSFNLGYSYYNTGSLNKIETFMINSAPSRYYLMDQDTLTDDPAGAASYMLGFSPHKVTLNLNYEFCKYFQVNLNTMLLGKRYGYETALYDSIGNETLYIREYKPFALVNMYFNFTNIMQDDLSIGFGIFNLLNSEYGYITPYLAYHGQIPAMGRELVFKVTYRID